MNTHFYIREVKLVLNEFQLKVIKAWAKERKMNEEDMIQLVFKEGYLTLRAEEKQNE